MGKKKPKKKDFDSCSVNTSTKEYFNQNQLSNDSIFEDSTNANHFKVLLCHNTEEKDNYYKWMKNCSWKNVAFVNSSVLSTLQCCAYIIIKSEQFSSIFIARPLRTVKKSAVVILNGMGFKHEELVSIYPFMGEGYEAEEIFLTPSSEFEDSEIFKTLLKRKLCNQFIWPDLKVELVILKTKYEFKITKVKYFDSVCLRNFSRISDCLESSSEPHVSFLSDSIKKDKDSINDSALHLSRIFSAVTLQDSANITSTTSDPQFTSNKFFTLSHQTAITFCNEMTLKISKFPLFEHIGGYKEQVLSIKTYIKEFLEETNEKAKSHRILLLKGPSGTGKSMILNAVCNENNIYTEKIYKNSLYCQDISEACKEITLKINNLSQRSKSILFLDDFDILCPSKLNLSNSRIVNLLCELISKQKNLLVLTATSAEINYDEHLIKFYSIQEIKFALPTTSDRKEIIEKVLDNLKHNLSHEQIKLCAECSQGMSGGEILKTLKYNGSLLSLIRIKNTSSLKIEPENKFLNFIDAMTAIKKKKQLIVSPNFESKKVRWSDIGGMNEIKEKLKEEMELAQMSPENVKRFNYSPSRGILFYGPPGCCKTMIARALATECNWNFISKKASDILNMYVGESEKAVSNLFLEARIRAPCIIFLDEIDALAPERSSCASASGVGNRIVNALLTEMAGIETLKDVMVIAATNRPNIIDTALLRRGRIGQHIYIPLPDNATRKEIFLLSMKRRSVVKEVDFNSLVERTNGYTGAEIVHLCNEAAMQLLTDDPECSSPVFKMEHFERALFAVPPRTSKETIQFYEQFSLQS